MTYPHERQVEYWTSRAIEEYFANEGYCVVVLPNSQRAEHDIPFDHLFAGRGLKVFGLQYKRMHPQPEDHWQLDCRQHQQMGRFPWIYYAFSEIRSAKQHRNALHLLSLREARFPCVCQLRPSYLGKIGYARWGGFVQGLFCCKFGWQVSTPDEIRTALSTARELADALLDVYLVTLETRVLVRVSPFLKDVSGYKPESLEPRPPERRD